MVAAARTSHKTVRVSRLEASKLYEIRRATLDDACKAAFLGQPLPTAWRWGWRALLLVHERDRDGSLKATVAVRGPGLEETYRRRIRLVTTEPRRSHGELELRES